MSPRIDTNRSPKMNAVQITDYNFQCKDSRSPSHSLLDKTIDREHLSTNILRAQVKKILSGNNSTEQMAYQYGSQELQNNPEIQMTVKNENLFSMMQESYKKKDEGKPQASNMNLSKMMGNL